MVFSSIIFLLLFLPVTLFFYFISGKKYKNFILLLASLFFYAWGEGFYVCIMITSIIINYTSGLLIEKNLSNRLSKIFLYSAVIINLAILFLFKYLNFIFDNINHFLTSININPVEIDPIHLPIGISFFTFQAISYVIDVYREETPSQKNILNMGLYIASFPQLIAGPIIRYHDVARQLVQRTITQNDFAAGVKRFIVGLGKKVLIANTMAVVVDKIYALPAHEISSAMAWTGTFCYYIQLYFDFSGYSDMAIGLGRMFGFHFAENFNYPFVARSMQDFWRRWHISLTSWMRDYLFLPLALKKRKWRNWGIVYALIIAFSFIGLWHGASWNFVVWGLFHGVFLSIEQLGFNKLLGKIWIPIKIVYVNIIVLVSLTFFRAENLYDAFLLLSAMFTPFHGMGWGNVICLFDIETFIVIIAGILFGVPLFPFLMDAKEKCLLHLKGMPSTLVYFAFSVSSVLFLSGTLLASIMNLAAGVYNPFIYFRF